MENQANSKSIILNFGLYYGIGLVLLSVIMYAMGMHLEGGAISPIVMGLVIIATIVLGIKKFKLNNNGFLSFGQAIKIGVGIAVVGTLLSIVYQQIFINFIEPDFMEQVSLKLQQTWVDAGLSEEQIEAQLEMQKKMSGPVISSALGLLFYAFIGFVISAIAGAIMKKTEENEY